MDAQQHRYFTESLQLCERLLSKLKQDNENAPLCFNGEILKAYLESTEIAVREIKVIRAKIQTLMQSLT